MKLEESAVWYHNSAFLFYKENHNGDLILYNINDIMNKIQYNIGGQSLKKVTVIVPLYNSEKHIHPLLDNLLTQTYQNVEVLLINDGSPDATHMTVLEEMKQRQDERITYLQKENGGIADTKNFGLVHATGDYIMFCDHDDMYAQNAVELLVEALESSNSDMAVGVYVREFKYKKSILEKLFPFQVTLDAFPKAGGTLIENKAMLVEIYQALWGKLYVRHIFDGFQFNADLNGMDDLGSTSILLAKANRIVGVHSVLYHYAYYKNSTIQSATSTFENRRIYEAFDDIERWYKENNLYESYKMELEYLYFYHCVLSYSVRTLQRSQNYLEEMKEMHRRLVQRYPNFHKNTYYKDANIFMKLFLPLSKNKFMLQCMHFILK